jgi:large subunit ribosomal protein L3
MEYIIEKIGMSRTIGTDSSAVTLCKVCDTKVCSVDENGTAFVAYPKNKTFNKTIKGQQDKYGLSKEYNNFATLKVANKEAGDIDMTPLSEAKLTKVSFNSKGRGFQGVVKRHNFAGGPASHGSRFHRRVGSIGNAEWPGRVQKGRKMPGQYGNTKVTVKADVVSFDAENKIVVLKGSVPGTNGSFGRIKVVA